MVKRMNFGHLIESENSASQQVALMDLVLVILQNST